VDSEKFPRGKRSRKGQPHIRSTIDDKAIDNAFYHVAIVDYYASSQFAEQKLLNHHSYSKTKRLHDNSPWIWSLQTLGPSHSTNDMTLFCVKHHQKFVIFSPRSVLFHKNDRKMDWRVRAYASNRSCLSNLSIWHIFTFILRLTRNECVVRFSKEKSRETAENRTKRN